VASGFIQLPASRSAARRKKQQFRRYDMTIDRSRAPLRALALATLFFAPWAHA
jgi:hypothetical protein